MPPSSQKYVKYELLTCIGTRHKQIRSTACTVISVLLQIVGFDKWADLFETLRLCFDSQDLNQKEGAAETIYKICENFPEDSIVDAGLRDLLIYDFVPRLMQLFESPHMSLRRLYLLFVNQCNFFFLFLTPPPPPSHISPNDFDLFAGGFQESIPSGLT